MPLLTIQEEQPFVGCLVRNMGADLEQQLTMLVGPPIRDPPTRQAGDTSIGQDLKHPPLTSKFPATPSPFVTIPASSGVMGKRRKSMSRSLVLLSAPILLP